MIKRYDGKLGHVEDGNYVSYKDYAELQQKLDALAAENAAREIMFTDAIHASIALTTAGVDVNNYEDSIFRLHEWGSLPDYCIAVYVDCIHGKVSENKLLDFGYIKGRLLTDAYLNSVRAEGVDMVAEAIGNSAAKLKVGSKDLKSLKSIVFTLVNFAAQLRSGTHDTADKAG